MALLALDGFDHFSYKNRVQKADVLLLQIQGTIVDGPQASDGKFPFDYAINTFNSTFNLHFLEYEFGTTTLEIIIGAKIRFTDIGGGLLKETDFLQAGLGVGTIPGTYTRRVVIAAHANGKIQFYQNRSGLNFDSFSWPGSSVLVTETSAGVLVPGTWASFEFKLTSPLGVVVKKDGVEVFNDPAADFLSGGFNRAGHAFNSFGSFGYDMDCFYVLSTTGNSPTTYLYPWRIATSWPKSDQILSQWTPSTSGTHFSKINDRVAPTNFDKPDADATYVSASIPAIDIHQMERLYPIGNGTVYAVQQSISAKTNLPTQIGQIKALAYYIPTATTYASAVISVPYYLVDNVEYRTFRKLWTVNPMTLNPWGMEDISDNWFFGFENIASEVRVSQMVIERLSDNTGLGAFSIYRVR